MKVKKIPLRMCIACHTMYPKKSLLRIVKDTSGQISLDLTGKKNGRGAYICNEKSCFEKLKKQRLLNKTFQTEVDIAVYDKIGEDFANK